MQRKFSYITRPILILSLVSLFTDMASEMLYPVMPVFLKSIGFSVLLIGILEGFAEMVAGLSKGYFGQLSDIRNKRVPFVRWGYLLSAISKPMLAVFQYPLWIFFARTVDRTGKGLRSSPRDALLSRQSTKENKAKIFGFHRAMDTFGAVLGPALAILFLHYYPGQYNLLFLFAFIPGIIAVLFTFSIRENPGTPSKQRVHLFSFVQYIKNSGKPYKKLLIGLVAFALVNSSDVLLLLKMKSAGVADTVILFAYIFYNIVYALAAFPAGIFADRYGIKKVFITGLILFVGVYAGFAFTESTTAFFILFFLYGVYAACTEGIAKAWISNITPQQETGTAIGAYASLSSISTFIASSLAGGIWYAAGASFAFSLTAIVTSAVVIWLAGLRYQPIKAGNSGD